VPYAALGDEACAQLRATGKKLSRLVMDAGLMGAMARAPIDDD
jgi:hypothetical protein